MFGDYFTMLERQRACRRAKRLVRHGHKIPLDLFATLNELGVDVEELERKAING